MSKSKKNIRKSFRDSVFARDRYTCQVCGTVFGKKDSEPELNVINAHHIIDRTVMPGGGYVKENGITLCDVGFKNPSCHILVEEFYHEIFIFDEEYEARSVYHPENLFKRIKSSYKEAFLESEKIK